MRVLLLVFFAFFSVVTAQDDTTAVTIDADDGHTLQPSPASWEPAQVDTQDWLAWLYEQPGVGAVYVMGSSMGANLALVSCAEAPRCDGSIALSPGLYSFGVFTEDALRSGKPALLVYAERDYRPARDIPQMQDLPEASLTVQTYPERTHGVDLLDAHDDLLSLIIEWMRR